VVLAVLPRLVCPCQLTAYTGLLASAGLTILLESRLQFSLTAAALTLAVGGLALGATRRRGYAPFWMGCGAAATILVGKFVLAWTAAVYAGSVLLLAVSIWNSWPVPQAKWAFDAEGRVVRRRKKR
jgi:hypothetical protein